MQTQTNGYHASVGAPAILTIDAIEARMDLNALDDVVGGMDSAMRDAAAARLTLGKLNRTLESVEAPAVRRVEGANAEQRNARLTLLLMDDARHLEAVSAIDVARARLYDSERRVTTARARVQALRGALALATGHEP